MSAERSAVPRSGRLRPPAYQWYPADFWNDRRVRLMSRFERDMYRELLDSQWLDGPLPGDMETLAAILREPVEVVSAAWPRIAPCFATLDDGRLVNLRMVRELERLQSISSEASNAARIRWEREREKKAASDADVMRAHSERNADALRTQCTSASAATSAATSEETPPRTAKPRRPKPPGSDADASVAPTADPINSSPAPEPLVAKPARKAPTGPHAELIAWWVTAWHEARGTDWVVGAKDGAAAKRLLTMTKGDLAAIKARGDRLLCHSNPWHAERASLAHLASQWNELGVESLPLAVAGGARGMNGHANRNGRVLADDYVKAGMVTVVDLHGNPINFSDRSNS